MTIRVTLAGAVRKNNLCFLSALRTIKPPDLIHAALSGR